MDTNLHDLIHLKEQLNLKMRECYELSKRVDEKIDEMVKDEPKS